MIKINLIFPVLCLTIAGLAPLNSFASEVISSTGGGIKLQSADGSQSFQVGGRLQWDYTDDDNPDAQDFDVRRARLYAKGKAGDWGYKIQFNVGESESSGSAEDLYIQYFGWGKQATVTIGKQYEPFGLEALTSSKYISMLERSASTEAYVPGRNAGVKFSGVFPRWTYAVGLFESDGDGESDFEEQAFTGRFTYAPVLADKAVVHVGGAFSQRSQTEGDDTQLISAEVALSLQSFHAQAEYFQSDTGLASEPSSYYAQVGYVVTGEHRPYKQGVFSSIQPDGEFGAVEIVARFEKGEAKYSDIGLGSADGSMWGLGLNYYPSKHVRLGATYMSGELENSDQEGREFRARFQFTF